MGCRFPNHPHDSLPTHWPNLSSGASRILSLAEGNCEDLIDLFPRSIQPQNLRYIPLDHEAAHAMANKRDFLGLWPFGLAFAFMHAGDFQDSLYELIEA